MFSGTYWDRGAGICSVVKLVKCSPADGCTVLKTVLSTLVEAMYSSRRPRHCPCCFFFVVVSSE